LENVVRHAAARHVRVRLAVATAGLELAVADDGTGFDPRAVPEDRYGLQGVRERAELLGGHVEVASVAGRGTTVTLTVPGAGSP
jgi:signal transduction histidine kinase